MMYVFQKYVLPALALAFTYLSPMFYWFGAIGMFIGLDLIVRVLILKRDGTAIESCKMWRTVYKFGIGCAFIMVGYACQLMFVPDIPVMKIIGSYLIIVELKSLDEKAKELTGFSLFSFVIDKIVPNKTKDNG